MTETFLNGRITLYSADCLDVLGELDECSVDSVCTDPPYHLQSIVKRFGGENAAPAQFGTDGRYARASAGFMGRKWDGGDIAFRPETWAAVRRVLKPGGHLLALGGTRTFHRVACAIEDAGFEIRDTIMWLYASGFPKSHDVSKGIDRAAGVEREVVGPSPIHSRGNATSFPKRPTEKTAAESGRVAEQIAERAFLTAAATDAARQWDGWGTALKPACEPIVLARKPLSEKTVAQNVLRWGTGAININGCRVEVTGQRPYDAAWESDQPLCASCAGRVASTTKPSTPETKESIAASLVEQTLSAKDDLNQADIFRQDIGCSDGMRAESTSTNFGIGRSGSGQTDQSQPDLKSTTSMATSRTTDYATCDSCGKAITSVITNASMPLSGNGSMPTQDGRGREGEPSANRRYTDKGATNFAATPGPRGGDIKGRWPSNLIHDGSEEVVAAFPDGLKSGAEVSRSPETAKGYRPNAFGAESRPSGVTTEWYGDSGSAARFFYTAKADADDRLGSAHPTVKPLDLMQYLVRLVTPRGGVVLDPFAGTGTTGEAAWREGMRAVLIEREAEYQEDIRRRMALVLAGPDEKAHAIIKAKGLTESPGPLFDALRNER